MRAKKDPVGCVGETVSEYLIRDHEEMDALLGDAKSALEERDLTRAQRAFAEFRGRMERHLRAEEEHLFPLLDRRSYGDPTTGLLDDHRSVQAELAWLGAALDRDDLTVFLGGYRRLVRLLATHNRKEEGMLCPMLDALLTDEERRELVGRLRGG